MKLLEIKCSLRESVGKKETLKLRKSGDVPCVLYGGEENIHFKAPENDFRHLVYTPHVYIVKLNISGKIYSAVMQDIQFHPVSDKIIHIDFYQVFDDKPVSIHIPVQLNGVPAGVKQGGKLALEARRLKTRALPGDLPDVLQVDVTKIGLGKSIKVGELKFPGLEILESSNQVLASVKLTRAARGGGAEDAEEEGAEQAQGESSEGGESAEGAAEESQES